MNGQAIKALMARPIAFHRAFVDLGVGITGAVMLSQAFYWSQKTGDGWFFKSQDEWTPLSSYAFACNPCGNLGFPIRECSKASSLKSRPIDTTRQPDVGDQSYVHGLQCGRRRYGMA